MGWSPEKLTFGWFSDLSLFIRLRYAESSQLFKKGRNLHRFRKEPSLYFNRPKPLPPSVKSKDCESQLPQSHTMLFTLGISVLS